MPLLITADFPPQHGGIQRYMARLAEEFAARSQPIAVVAPSQAGSDEYDAARPYATFRYLPLRRPLRLASMFGVALRAGSSSGREYTVASSWFPAGLVAALIPRALRGPLAIVAHGAELTGQGKFRRLLMRTVFGRADVIFANSAFTCSLLKLAGVNREPVITYCGVDSRPVLDTMRANDPTIVSVGRLVPRKGFDRVIAALAVLRLTVPNVRYEVVGAGPDRGRLTELARRLGVAEHVRFLGAIDDDALQRAYQRAWCFALPVRNDGGSVEGFGIVYLEAAVAGLPVIGGRGSGADEALADGVTGYLVDGDDTDELARRLGRLLTDPELANAMGRRGRERALAEFTWSHIAGKINAAMEAHVHS